MLSEYIKDKAAQVMGDIKQIHRSMTIWFNALCGSILLFMPDAVANFPQIQPYIPDAVFKHGMAVLIVGNMLLRFKTSSALRDK
jgi:hypothetical protein